MMSPFDRKNKLASCLDRLALRALLFALCVGYFFFLWRSGLPSLLCGGALFLLVLLALMLLERRTLKRRDRMLRERVGGMIALEELIMLPGRAACQRVCDLLCETLSAESLGGAVMRYGGETWLVRCAQCLQGSSASQGDVLSAHRARIEAGADYILRHIAARRGVQQLIRPHGGIAYRQVLDQRGNIGVSADIGRHIARKSRCLRFDKRDGQPLPH